MQMCDASISFLIGYFSFPKVKIILPSSADSAHSVHPFYLKLVCCSV
jgi:hypothetical protein